VIAQCMHLATRCILDLHLGRTAHGNQTCIPVEVREVTRIRQFDIKHYYLILTILNNHIPVLTCSDYLLTVYAKLR